MINNNATPEGVGVGGATVVTVDIAVVFLRPAMWIMLRADRLVFAGNYCTSINNMSYPKTRSPFYPEVSDVNY